MFSRFRDPERSGGFRQKDELEAFAQFGSDLDAITQRQLARGARTVEMLKQPQYRPMAVESQVTLIYAVTNGFLDDVAVDKVREWEAGFHDDMAAKHQDVLDEIRESGQLTDELNEKLVAAIEGYNASFAAEHTTVGASA